MGKLIHSPENKKIDFLDDRFYTKDGVNFYPSVTTVLDVYPKGYGFIQWLKDLGANAEQVVERAAEQGTHVHDAIDQYLSGVELVWKKEGDKENYTLEEWRMILRFVDFWTTHKPKLLANEQDYISEQLGVGGTLDLVCQIGKDIWLIDYKSGNAVYKSYEFQLAAYERMWNGFNTADKRITRRGVLHLKAATRGPDSRNKNIQGEGWKLHEFTRTHEEAFSIFEHVHALWREENPNPKPKNLVYPDRVKLVVEKAKV